MQNLLKDMKNLQLGTDALRLFQKNQCFHQFFVTFADLWIKITFYAESNSAVFTDNLSDSARRLSFLARVQQVYLELNVIICWTLLMITKSKSRLDLAYHGSSRVRGRRKKMTNPHGYEFTFVNLSLSRLCKCYLPYGNNYMRIYFKEQCFQARLWAT